MRLLLRTVVLAAVLAVPSHASADGGASSQQYAFPFSKIPVTYPRDHVDYPAADVEGCYARVLAPTAGTVTQTHTRDKWVKEIDAPGTRGGKTVTIEGDDNVRYFFSHLGRVKVRVGQRVVPGDWIGVMGSSGNARVTRCHTHFGISRICPLAEAYLLRGEIWPQRYLDAWRKGKQLSPRREVAQQAKKDPQGCIRSRADTRAASPRSVSG
jgi:peptidoglycan LD-endopeptidase LytH